MSTGTLELAIRGHLSALAFKKFSENPSNTLCIPFSSFSKIGIMSRRQVYGVVSSAKLVCSRSLTSKKRPHIQALNKSGPKTELWGTPNKVAAQQLNDEFILVFCVLSARYELIKIEDLYYRFHFI